MISAALRVALACVLATLPALAASADPAQDYMLNCMGCHGSQAAGIPGKVPSLARTLRPLMASPAGRRYVLQAPGAANSALSDEQLASVLNWITSTFDSSGRDAFTPFNAAEVSTWRRSSFARRTGQP
jgi:mono/diheme cytochrome c family protein